MEMTDLEMTKLCAEAVGLHEMPRRTTDPQAKYPDSSLRMARGNKAAHWYDPLHDDAQIMALVKKLHLSLATYAENPGIWEVWVDINPDNWISTNNLNRSVVKFVAASKMKSPVQPPQVDYETIKARESGFDVDQFAGSQ